MWQYNDWCPNRTGVRDSGRSSHGTWNSNINTTRASSRKLKVQTTLPCRLGKCNWEGCRWPGQPWASRHHGVWCWISRQEKRISPILSGKSRRPSGILALEAVPGNCNQHPLLCLDVSSAALPSNDSLRDGCPMCTPILVCSDSLPSFIWRI